MTRILLLFLFSVACILAIGQTPTYEVREIKTIRKYYVIYAVNDDSTYKIVSKKEKLFNCENVKTNERYPFVLSKIQSLTASEIDCFSFDEKTVICKEPDVELVLASNLKGLCFITQTN